MTGAFTQQPRHSTSRIVNRRSGVVSPKVIPSFCSQVFTTSSEPRSQHGVVVHICKCHLPIGAVLNIK